MTGVQDDFVALAIGNCPQGVNNISLQLLLTKDDVQGRGSVQCSPVVVVGQGIWITRWIYNSGRHGSQRCR